MNLLLVQEMGRGMPQLEFKWTSWLKVFRPAPPAQAVAVRSDGGLTAWCSDAAGNLDLPELSRKVRVSWNPRMQTTAGRARWPERVIELNPKLRKCAPEELWRTLKHELAHLVAYERSLRRRIEPHGREWRAACAELGIPDETPYHTLPFERRTVKRRHIYHCPHCESAIHRVKPIRRAVACYDCCRKFNGGSYHERFRLVRKIAN